MLLSKISSENSGWTAETPDPREESAALPGECGREGKRAVAEELIELQTRD
jgi:hypothetical protein